MGFVTNGLHALHLRFDLMDSCHEDEERSCYSDPPGECLVCVAQPNDEREKVHVRCFKICFSELQPLTSPGRIVLSSM